MQPGLFATAEHSLPVIVTRQKKQIEGRPGVTNSPAIHFGDVKTTAKTAGKDDTLVTWNQEYSNSDDGDDSSDLDEKDPIDVYKQLEKAASSVCLVVVIKDGSREAAATGFLVGDRYLMTALHTIKDYLVCTCLHSSQLSAPCGGSYCAGLHVELRSGVSVVANFSYNGGNYCNNGGEEVSVLHTPAAVLENLDTAVLEFDLTFASLPSSFPKCGFRKDALDFSKFTIDAGNVYLVGHNGAGPKQMDWPCKVKTAEHALQQLARYNLAAKLQLVSMPQQDQDAEDLQLVQGGNYVFIDCFFMNGASGCPMFRYDRPTGTLKLIAMFLRGFPSSHYLTRPKGNDEAADEYDKIRCRLYRTFEAGVTMAAVRAELSIRSPRLAAVLGW